MKKVLRAISLKVVAVVEVVAVAAAVVVEELEMEKLHSHLSVMLVGDKVVSF